MVIAQLSIGDRMLGGVLPEGSRYALLQSDAVQLLRELPPESIDCIVTDPAYESLEKHRAIGTTTRLKKSWFEIFPNSRFPEFFAECFRVLKRDAHLYLMCDAETMFVVKPIGEAEGFRFWKPIVWDKVNMGMGYHYRARCEFVLFFEKGKRALNSCGVSDIIRAQRVRGQYPTEKPVQLNKVLIGQSTTRGEVVLDPFMGSGSCGVAALELGRRFLGADISEDSLSCATVRLESVGVR